MIAFVKKSLTFLGLLFGFFLAPGQLMAGPIGNLAGTVTDAGTGAGISGVLIQVATSGTVMYSTTTDGSGAYSILNIPGDPLYDVIASKTGYQSATTTGIHIINKQTTVVNFQLSLQGRITGTVTNSLTGATLQNVTVTASQGGSTIGTATTAANGTYTILGLNPGSYTVSTSLTNYQPASSPATVVTNSTTTVNFSLLPYPGIFAGKITSSSTLAALSGATVSVINPSTQAVVATTTTNVTGDYSVSGIYPGTYTVQASFLNYYTGSTSGTIQSNVTTTVNLALTPKEGALTGVVLNAVTSGVLNNVTVTLLQGATPITSAQTDLSGVYSFSNLVPGSYTVVVAPPLFQSQSLPASVPPGGTATLNFSLQPNPGSMSGTVRDTNNVLLGSATVQLYRTDGITLVASTSTLSNGTYSLTGVVPGSYLLQAAKTHYQSQSIEVTVQSDQITPQNFSLPINPGAIGGTITSAASGLPIPGASVAVGLYGPATTVANGSYFLTGIPPGSYQVTISGAGFQQVVVSSVTISSDVTTTLSRALTPNPGGLSGVVTDALTTTGISGATVDVMSGASVVYTTTTGDGGAYSFSSIPYGTYNVRASKTNYAAQTVSASILSDQTITVSFPLQPNPGSLSGTVTSSSVPIVGASVQVFQHNTSQLVTSTVTISGGTYSFPSLVPGTYDVVASAIHYQTSPIAIVAIAPGTPATQNFSLVANTGAIGGTVTHSVTGQPISGVTVSVVGGPSVTTQTNGSYIISGLAPGNAYTVNFSKAHFISQEFTSQAVVSDQTTQLNVSLVPTNGTLSGLIKNLTSDPIVGATIDAMQNGIVIESTTSQGPDGHYTLSLFPGSYTARVQATNYQTGSSSVAIQSDLTTTADFTLDDQPGTVRVSVYDATSNPISGATVSALSGNVVVQSTTIEPESPINQDNC